MWLYSQDDFIGNHDGMPFVDRNMFKHKASRRPKPAAQAEVDRLRAAHRDWAAGNTPTNKGKGKWKQWKRRGTTR
ncbi:uncharacterized protein RMCB_4919 [Mycolicibacterium brisbanense]|uniref:Uncharacterized protein n=1 Tax=Mycolicibacterium brisbanense TaxID=146020 RepID=A0A100W390_9MYCO|nr:uncharacterized protein RMCB_4919 [Mycolicibacterium brisbanense]